MKLNSRSGRLVEFTHLEVCPRVALVDGRLDVALTVSPSTLVCSSSLLLAQRIYRPGIL